MNNNFQQADLFGSDRQRLNLDFSQQTYLRLLAMQYAMSAESKEAVVIQAFAVLEWLIDLAKQNPGASYLIFEEDGTVITMDKLVTLFDTKGGQ